MIEEVDQSDRVNKKKKLGQTKRTEKVGSVTKMISEAEQSSRVDRNNLVKQRVLKKLAE